MQCVRLGNCPIDFFFPKFPYATEKDSAKYSYIYETQKTENVSYYKEHEVSGGTTH